MELSFLHLVVVAIAYTAEAASFSSVDVAAPGFPSRTSSAVQTFSDAVPSPTLYPAAQMSTSTSLLLPSVSFPTAATIAASAGTVSSTALPMVSPTATPVSGPVAMELPPVFENSVVTYGNNTCEPYIAGGHCEDILSMFPGIVSNYSRPYAQFGAKGLADQFIGALISFNASEQCLKLAIPIVCRWTIPTCDPAFKVPTYQPLCRYDCEILRDFVCKKPWEKMLELLHLLNVPDTPDCAPLNDTQAGDAPMCVGTTRTGAVPLPQRTGDCYSGTGRGYEGTINTTESGIPCQSWNSTYPHQHLLYLEGFDELEGGHSYCRNPGNRGERPWCFTTDRDVRWEYCDVPRCANGGRAVCEPFSLNAPYGVCRTTATIGLDLLFINKSKAEQDDYDRKMKDIEVAIEGYNEECRDAFFEYLCITNFPQCDPSHMTPRPLLPCRSFCELIVSRCKDDISGLQALGGLVNYEPLRIEFECSSLSEAQEGEAPECYLPVTQPPESGNQTCYDPTNKGATYTGRSNVTESGRPCQKWNTQVPHPHPLTPVLRPYLDKHNYCRNPEGRGERPWCYTTDPKVRWEYCGIQPCGVTSSQLPLPLWAIAVIAAVCLTLVLLIVSATCCIACFRQKTSKEQKRRNEMSDHPRYAEGPVTFVGKKDLCQEENVSGTNPLYTRNSLLQQNQLEYDGVKLPEYPRSQIIYVRDLGQGHFGVVVQAEATNIEEGKEKSTVAIKVLKEGASPQVKKEFFREASLMCAFDHPNILKLLGVCIKMEPLCMIFEYMELGDLNNFLRKNAPNNWGSCTSLSHSGHLKPGQPCLTTPQLVFIAVDVATGLEYLAQNHYVHRDLATRNCLVSGDLRVKISDFGLSQDIYSTDYFRLGDSELLPIRWMPPEAILYAKFTTQSDVWSFGIVLWEIFSFGVQPYFSLTNEEVVAHVRDGNVLNCPDKCPQEIYDLMLDCWAMNPTERPTAAELHMGLGRWSPDLSATLQMQAQTQPVRSDYQNMATVREYAATQLSTNSSSTKALNNSNSVVAEGQFEMASAAVNSNGLGTTGGQFEMTPIATNPPESAVGSGQPTVAYSSCVGDGSTHMPDDQHNNITIL